jgi:hypothetical protein
VTIIEVSKRMSALLIGLWIFSHVWNTGWAESRRADPDNRNLVARESRMVQPAEPCPLISAKTGSSDLAK